MTQFDDGFDSPNSTATAPQPHKTDLGDVDSAMSAGTPAAKFETIGTIVTGVILSAEMAQQRDLATGTPAFWPDGNPKTQVLIALQTNERSADIEDDTGARRLYVKKPSAMLAAIAKALGKVKLSQAIGGTLAVKYTGDGEASQRGFNKPKQFAARFTPAAGHGSVDSAFDDAPARIAPAVGDASAARRGCAAAMAATMPGASKDAMNKAWADAYHQKFGTRQQATVTATEWNAFARELTDAASNASGGPGIPDDDIPFAPCVC